MSKDLFKINELGFITYISPEAITNGVLHIPKHYQGEEIVGIKSFAVPDEVKDLLTKLSFTGDVVIENQAFKNCFKLESVSFAGKTDIGKHGFANNTSLSMINFNSKGKETNIGEVAFMGCGIKNLTLQGNTNVESYAFSETPVKKIHLSGPDIKLGDKSFSDCKDLLLIQSEENCSTVLENNVFSGCVNLEQFDKTETIKEMGYGAFANCKSFHGDEDHGFIVMGKADDGALENTSIEALVYKSAQSIPRNFIRNNDALRGVFIYGEIPTIKSGAFENCKNNEVVFMPSSVQYIGNNAFYGNDSIHTVNVLSKLEIAVKQISTTSKFFNKQGVIELPQGVELGSDAIPFEYQKAKSKSSMIKLNLNKVSFEVKDIAAEQIRDKYASRLSSPQEPVEAFSR